MIILDTNVVSELMKPTPDNRVVRWASSQDGGELYIPTVVEAELRFGLALLPTGRRRDDLAAALDGLLEEDLLGRILPFDRDAAKAFASIMADTRRAGRPMSYADAQIAAVAKSHGAALATRNVADFAASGVPLSNPWSETS